MVSVQRARRPSFVIHHSWFRWRSIFAFISEVERSVQVLAWALAWMRNTVVYVRCFTPGFTPIFDVLLSSPVQFTQRAMPTVFPKSARHHVSQRSSLPLSRCVSVVSFMQQAHANEMRRSVATNGRNHATTPRTTVSPKLEPAEIITVEPFEMEEALPVKRNLQTLTSHWMGIVQFSLLRRGKY